MARYQIMYWKEIPAQVKATDEQGGRAKAVLPDRFAEAIDAAAMAEGSIESDAYLSGWGWGPMEERDGSAEEVVVALVNEMDKAYPPARLKQLVLNRKG